MKYHSIINFFQNSLKNTYPFYLAHSRDRQRRCCVFGGSATESIVREQHEELLEMLGDFELFVDGLKLR